MSEPPSPLLATNPDAISELFEADPLTLSDVQLMSLIVELRRRRSEFASSEAAKSLAPKKSRTKAEPQTAAEAAALDKSITEVGLDDI